MNSSIMDTFGNKDLSEIIDKYNRDLNKLQKPVFNIFELLPNYNYKELFHSNFIGGLLDIDGIHGENETFQKEFLNLISIIKKNPSLFGDELFKVKREKDHIDILLCNNQTMNCIIIESKINGAADGKQQLPTYLDNVKKRNFNCLAIVYISQNGKKFPDMSEWSEEQKKEIQDLIIYLPASNNSPNDLVNGWLNKCEAKINERVKEAIKQYIYLLNKLGRIKQANESMNDFFDFLKVTDNIEVVNNLK